MSKRYVAPLVLEEKVGNLGPDRVDDIGVEVDYRAECVTGGDSDVVEFPVRYYSDLSSCGSSRGRLLQNVQ